MKSGGAVTKSGGAVMQSGGAVTKSGGAVIELGGAVTKSGGAVINWVLGHMSQRIEVVLGLFIYDSLLYEFSFIGYHEIVFFQLSIFG